MDSMEDRDFQATFEPMVIINDENDDEEENFFSKLQLIRKGRHFSKKASDPCSRFENFKTAVKMLLTEMNFKSDRASREISPLTNENQPLSIGPEVTIFPVKNIKKIKSKPQFKIRLFERQSQNSPSNSSGELSDGSDGSEDRILAKGAKLPVRRVTREEALYCEDTYAKRRSSPLEKCPICKKFFRRMKSHLIKHEILQQEEVLSKLTCQFCAKVFNNHANLQIHMRTHTGDKPYVCEVCDKSFSQSCNLVNHMRIHTGEKPFKCPHCDRAFTQSGNLNNHIRLHTDEKPFKCHYCNKAFVQSGNLNSHIRNNHKLDTDDGYNMISIKG